MNEIERAIEFIFGQQTLAEQAYLKNTDERVIARIDKVVAYYDLAIKALRAELSRQENEPLTLRGYDIERLELVAELMKQRQITPDDLKKCVGNFAHALKMVMEVVEKQTAEALQAVSDAREPEHAPEKGADK